MHPFSKFIKIILAISLIVNIKACSSLAKQPTTNFFWKPLLPYGSDAGDFPLSHLRKVPYATYSYKTGDAVINLHGGKTNSLSIMDYVPIINLFIFNKPVTLSKDRCARIAPFTYLFCRGQDTSNCDITSEIVPRIPDNLWAREYAVLGVNHDLTKREKVTTFVRKTRDRKILREIAQDIVTTYPDQVSGRISLEWALIITWKDVQFFREPFQGSGTNVTVSPRSTFQVALTSTSDGHMTFLVINHDEIDWKFEEIRENVKFEASIDRMQNKLKEQCKEANLNGVNIGVSGRFVYRLDNAFVFKEIEAGNTCPINRNQKLRVRRSNYYTIKVPPNFGRNVTKNIPENVTERVRIFPEIISIMETRYLNLKMDMSGACLQDTDSRASCHLEDSDGTMETLMILQGRTNKNGELGASLVKRDRDTFLSLGRKTVKMEVAYHDTGTVHTFYGHIYIVENPSMTKMGRNAFNETNRRVACLNFINSSRENFIFPNDTEICPPSLEFAKRDPRFEVLSGHLNTSFRQRVPAPSGAASVCSYNETNNNLLVGYPAGATSLRFHPAYDYWKHQLQDKLPKELCCSDANKENCRGYYNRRPSKDSTGYVMPRAARAVGAGHITTFDDAKQTLRGTGEFLLMDYKSPKVDGISLKVQVRMKQYLSSRGIRRKSSVFTAFAMEESRVAGDTIRIQVEDKGVGSGIHVMLDGEPMHVDFNQLSGSEQKFTLRWKSMLLRKTLEPDEVEVTFASGFTFRFTSPSANEMGLNLMVMGSYIRDNVRFNYEDIEMRGLLGDCDHNPENDFTGASEQDKILGLPWKILLSEDSIFTYDGDGESFDSYNKPALYKSDFNLTEALHSDHDGNLKLLCGNQEDCIYDLQTTDSVPLAQATKSSNDEFENLRLFYQGFTGVCLDGKDGAFQRGWTKNAYDLVKYLPEGKRLKEKCFPGYEMKIASGESELICDCKDKGEWKCTGGWGVSCVQVEMKQEENGTEATTENVMEPVE